MLQKSKIDEQRNHSKKIHQSDPKNQPFLAPFLKLYNFIVSAGAIPVRLIFFQNIGERSISFTGWIISLAGHFAYVYLYAVGGFGVLAYLLMPEFLREKIEIIEQSYAFLSVLLVNGVSIYFIRAILYEGIRLFRYSGENSFDFIRTKGSYYRGDSILLDSDDYIGSIRKTFFGTKMITEENFRIFIEPRKIFIFGLLFSLISLFLSILLLLISNSLFGIIISIFILSHFSVGILVCLSAICLFLEEFGIYKRIRHAALDIVDGEKDLQRIMLMKDKIEGKIVEEKDKANEFPEVKIF